MNLFNFPVRRPVATSMAFLGVFVLGWIAWNRISVELIPPVSGEQLYVSFTRPGSDPDVVEREILLPLEARVAELPGVEETWGEVRGSTGSFSVRFQTGTDLKVRELDLRRLAAELVRTQPRATAIEVDSQDLTVISRFAMFVQVLGMEDRNSLLDFVDRRVLPRLASVPGASRVMAGGGAPQEMTVRIDPDRCAAQGVLPSQVTAALNRSVRRLRFLGGVEDEAGRTAVLLDGRPRGVVSLAELRIVPNRPVLLHHVADVSLGTGREEILFRVNGQPTVGMVVFQEEGANLIRLGRGLRAKLDELRDEFRDYGLDFVINFDAAEVVEEQLDRLKRLALWGFVIALAVLFLFLRQFRAVAVVAVAVPASLLSALALLFVTGQSINLITLFGLAVGIGMLVDNSIVVYEAVQRQLERGADPDRAAEYGVRRTGRAILAATVTNAIVYLPIAYADFSDPLLRAMLVVMALAILLPMLGSLVVAVGLVPLLARRLAAPAALARLAVRRRRREALGGLTPPDRAKELFSGLLVVALRRPTTWVTVVVAAVLLTVVVALPWVAVGTATQEPPEARQVRFQVDIDAGHSLERATGLFERLETAAMALEGLKLVESVVQEQGGTLTVHLEPKEERPDDVDAGRVRHVVMDAAQGLPDVEIVSQSQGFGGGGGGAGRRGGGGLEALLGQSAATAVLSGSDAEVLRTIAREVREQLQSIPEMGQTSIEGRTGQHEVRVIPEGIALEAYGLTADQVLPALSIVRREGVAMRTGFTLHDGREIPMTVRREADERSATQDLRDLRLATPGGVLPLSAVATVRKMPPPPTILHHNGRREIGISYRLSDDAPTTGPARQALDDQIETAIQNVHRPPGYTIETPDPDETFNWFKKILVPVVLLLFAVLALTFESLTLPVLVLLALPLTMLGATWALVFAGMPANYMALVGILALIGLTVNPAILLVDRMQHRAWRGGMSAGAAALAAVRERARPVLMTATTTVAGLWPLALVTGRENEIWPPFATVVMGGLVTSTLLTLLVVPVGFVFLHRLDRLFGKLGPWVMIGWLGAITAVMTPLIVTDTISSLTWQIVSTLLVAAALLGVAVLIFRRPQVPRPEADDGPPVVEVRHLHKVYGRPGPVGRAWRVSQRFAEAVRKFGGCAFDPRDAAARLLPIALVLAGTLYLAFSLRSVPWRMVFLFVAAALVAAFFKQLRGARGCADELGRVHPGGPESVVGALAPWAAMTYMALRFRLLAWATNLQAAEASESFFKPEPYDIRTWVLVAFAVVLLVVQLGRRTAVRLARGHISMRLEAGSRLRRARALWRRFSRFCFGLDLPREEVRALAGVDFRAERGMVGILGPNGAGKTTLLRMLAGILEPTLGTVYIGSVRVKQLRRFLARWVGYLPQDFGLPKNLTAREYLDYYALLYELHPAERRRERVGRLLEEVGLGKRADEKIGSFSGGMRQRVAVARTLLRLPPVIVVDEPTVGLDPRERIRFRNLLSRLAEGRVVLFSTHVVEDVEVACERVIVLARGRIVFDGEPTDLAAAADGKVWAVTQDRGAEAELPAQALVVDQVPEGDSAVRSRILATERPLADAESVAPTLEDGYLWLVGARSAA
jgi:multidrug efflux pump subunit AcrB/ABC-type multidrug transport system ATPase subunit